MLVAEYNGVGQLLPAFGPMPVAPVAKMIADAWKGEVLVLGSNGRPVVGARVGLYAFLGLAIVKVAGPVNTDSSGVAKFLVPIDKLKVGGKTVPDDVLYFSVKLPGTSDAEFEKTTGFDGTARAAKNTRTVLGMKKFAAPMTGNWIIWAGVGAAVATGLAFFFFGTRK